MRGDIIHGLLSRLIELSDLGISNIRGVNELGISHYPRQRLVDPFIGGHGATESDTR